MGGIGDDARRFVVWAFGVAGRRKAKGTFGDAQSWAWPVGLVIQPTGCATMMS